MSGTLTEKSLERLRRLAEGNGLGPDAFQLIEADEAVRTINARLKLNAKVDVKGTHYAGPPQGKKIQKLPSFAALEAEIKQLRQSFASGRDWIDLAVKELQAEPNHGWGKDGAKIPLQDKTTTYAASGRCPVCQGQAKLVCDFCRGEGSILCPFCHGQREEPCYTCFGRGVDPVNPNQPCPTCRGRRFAFCRNCQGTGRLPCTDCHGHGAVACLDCKGTGLLTQEVAVTPEIEIKFNVLDASQLPSGLLRSLDRLGMANLDKGHGDIELIVPEDEHADPTELFLRAAIPYADIKLRLAGKGVMIAAFGKRCRLSGVPMFLDASLRPWREALIESARGKASLDRVLEARAMRDALSLILEGKTRPDDLRRIYPIGLSREAAGAIMRDMGKALGRITLNVRLGAAAVLLLLSVAVFVALYLPAAREFIAGLSNGLALALRVIPLFLMMGFGWLGLAQLSRFVLRRRFPGMPVKLTQGAGRIGYGLMVSIALAYGGVFAFMKWL